jgi:16S rRNA (uracil1498-N3)-methyltransferase
MDAPGVREGREVSARRVLVPEITGRIEIGGEAARHLVRVLRVRPGEELVVFDGSGREADAVVEEVNGRRVLVQAGLPRPATTEPDLVIHCHAALVKHADRYAEMVRALVELGASSITPLLSERSVAGPAGEGRLERWRRVAAEAARQSGRAVVPAIGPVTRLGDLALPPGATGVVADPGAPPPGIPAGTEEVVLVTGPEGGFTAEEVAGLCARGFRRAGLGPRILRADTAAVALLAALTAARAR